MKAVDEKQEAYDLLKAVAEEKTEALAEAQEMADSNQEYLENMESYKKEYAGQVAEAETAKNTAQTAFEEKEAERAEIAETLEAVDAAGEVLANAIMDAEEARMAYDDAVQGVADAKANIVEKEQALEEAKARLEAAKQVDFEEVLASGQYDESNQYLKEYVDKIHELETAVENCWEELGAAKALLEEKEPEYKEALKAYNEALAELALAEADYREFLPEETEKDKGGQTAVVNTGSPKAEETDKQVMKKQGQAPKTGDATGAGASLLLMMGSMSAIMTTKRRKK